MLGPLVNVEAVKEMQHPNLWANPPDWSTFQIVSKRPSICRCPSNLAAVPKSYWVVLFDFGNRLACSNIGTFFIRIRPLAGIVFNHIPSKPRLNNFNTGFAEPVYARKRPPTHPTLTAYWIVQAAPGYRLPAITNSEGDDKNYLTPSSTPAKYFFDSFCYVMRDAKTNQFLTAIS